MQTKMLIAAAEKTACQVTKGNERAIEIEWVRHMPCAIPVQSLTLHLVLQSTAMSEPVHIARSKSWAQLMIKIALQSCGERMTCLKKCTWRKLVFVRRENSFDNIRWIDLDETKL